MIREVKFDVENGSGGRPRTKDITFKGHKIRVYTIGWLSYTCFLAQVTLRLWEREGVLPKPFFKLAHVSRYYTPAEILVYSKLIREHYATGRDKGLLKQMLIKAHSDIRKKYLSLKDGEKVSDNLLVLPEEKAIWSQYDKHKTKKKLSTEHYHEVMELMK